MRVILELEDDSNQDKAELEFRVELFTNKDIEPGEIVRLAAGSLEQLVRIEDKEEKAKRTREIMEAMKSELGNRGAVVMPNDPKSSEKVDPNADRPTED
ncbi:hypothetical protein HOS75_gp047 [Gordonia phage SteveFrench]|uniref:Uncharacterized protein n=2 Tax=Montyvirus stevefrench TaxID=2734258 RepID=A0A890UT51_9CAUD|nr:hypothetical protein HOS75_gp047 [Gordonia phage SteveFrench]AUV60683.1 hypothetical protein SEA_STEVEFRENCH_81 [Gordonia phage SteveFrench]QRI45666.1 hypothetical protein SEA_ROYALG_82 [Gordonia phage RoyalG]